MSLEGPTHLRRTRSPRASREARTAAACSSRSSAARYARKAAYFSSAAALDRRFVWRVPQQPYLRFDTNEYSLDARLAGRRVEVRVSQGELRAVALDTGELACRHRRSFARHLTFTDPPTSESSSACAGSDVGGRRSSCVRSPAMSP